MSQPKEASGRERARLDDRTAGLLLHPTSLAGPFESGDLGPAAHAFADFVADSGCRWWQMLPLGPVGHGSSPYATTSVFAGSAELVSLERLAIDGFLAADDACLAPAAATRRVDFEGAKERRQKALRAAFAVARDKQEVRAELEGFERANAFWLHDYATFAALKERFGGQPFFAWPAELKRRESSAMAAVARESADEIAFQKFVQLRFARDLDALTEHARTRGVALMGDAPIYVAHDSADVWAHPELFMLGEDGDPAVVAGVPPDAFSDEGQRWGNPLYDWHVHEETGFGFWTARLQHQLRAFDAVRLDHFIGFSRFYAIDSASPDAKRGTFHPVPGHRLFEAVFKALGPVQLVAEDLGVVTDAVRELRDHFRLPGMNILQFSFTPGAHAEPSRPHNYAVRSVVYTGTHDNDTAVGWFGGPPENASEEVRKRYEAERSFALEYLGLPEHASAQEACAELVRVAMRSHARTAIIPVQDALGLGREARMNRPGIGGGNWQFRVEPGELSTAVSSTLKRLAQTYGR